MKKGFININLNKLRNNFKYYKNNTNKSIIAVVKDNAYGHGLIKVAKALEDEGCSYFVVSSIDEALALRSNNIKGGILLLGYPEKHEYEMLSLNDISVAVYSLFQLNEITHSYFKYPLKIHIKINSGMQRNGISDNEIKDILNKIKKDPRINIVGIFTHYIGGDDCLNYLKNQFKLFHKSINKSFDETFMIHAASSNSFNLINENVTNYIRIGLGLYGLQSSNLNPVLELKAPIVQVYKAPKGTICGYDGVFTAKDDGYLYTLPIGYADGYKPILNHLAYKDDYLIQAGRVSMDYCSFFSTSHYMIGDEIELIGSNIKVKDIASKCDTTPYDIVASLSHKLKRNYII